jgi:sugar phosphate permease
MSLSSWLHLAVIAVVALVALVFQFGYPLVISLALLGAFVALAMLVGLTALDLAPKTPATRKFAARRLAVRSA